MNYLFIQMEVDVQDLYILMILKTQKMSKQVIENNLRIKKSYKQIKGWKV